MRGLSSGFGRSVLWSLALSGLTVIGCGGGTALDPNGPAGAPFDGGPPWAGQPNAPGLGDDAGACATSCGGVCTDTSVDSTSCGACGHACKPGELCASGACVADKLDKLSFDVVDARYSTALDRIVFVSAAPPALHVYDPAARKDTPVKLPITPTSVSVGPDGHKAVVGHDGHVSYVDLDAASVVGTFAVSAPIGDVVLGGAGKAYAFPSSDQWVAIHTIDLATGTDTPGSQVYAGTVGALHPSGTKMYAADRGVSPTSLYDFDLSGGAPGAGVEEFGADYGVCGNLWITRDGLRIITACGNVFSSSNDPSADMKYAGSLGQQAQVVWADDAAGRVAAVVVSQDPTLPFDQAPPTELDVFDAQYLAITGKNPMPSYRAGTKTVPTTGQFVFFRHDGSAAYVVVKADPSSNAELPYAVWTF